MTLSPLHRRVIIEATIDPLRRFRRGWARDKSGPFFPERTIAALLRSGALRRPEWHRPCSSAQYVTAMAA